MRLTLLSLLIVGACTQYPDDCNRRALRELRTVDRLIEETEQNLARGYAYQIEETGLRAGFTFCSGGYNTLICTGSDTRYRRRPVAIDPEAESRKLGLLRARREGLVEATRNCRPI
jgi:hypothetical protein